MRLFRRCKHTWTLKGVLPLSVRERMFWEADWTDTGKVTTIYYVCSTCQADKNRTVRGGFTLVQAKELFPNP